MIPTKYPAAGGINRSGQPAPPRPNRLREDLRLLGRELLVGEYSLRLQVCQILELVDRVDRRSGGSRGWRLRVLLLRLLRRGLLAGPLALLTVPHAARHR